MTNHWRNFDFAHTDLDAMFQNISYDQDDTLVMFGLDGMPASKC